MREPIVSVCMITYNHERFIAQAIEGVLMQKTDFLIELVIGEDCSTDGTRASCEQYAWSHPDRIRLLPSERNLGMQVNCQRAMEACRGKYIALCEGDDYWTDPLKLKKQVDVMDRDPSLSFCFHNAWFVGEAGQTEIHEVCYGDGKPNGICGPKPKSRIGLQDMVKWNTIPTHSVLIRRDAILPFPEWITTLPASDWGMHLHSLTQGDAAYIDEIMGVYRVHSGGTWSTLQTMDAAVKLYRQIELSQAALRESYDKALVMPADHIVTMFATGATRHLHQVLREKGGRAFHAEARLLAERLPEGRLLPRALVEEVCDQLVQKASECPTKREALGYLRLCAMASLRYLVRPRMLFRLAKGAVRNLVPRLGR